MQPPPKSQAIWTEGPTTVQSGQKAPQLYPTYEIKSFCGCLLLVLEEEPK